MPTAGRPRRTRSSSRWRCDWRGGRVRHRWSRTTCAPCCAEPPRVFRGPRIDWKWNASGSFVVARPPSSAASPAAGGRPMHQDTAKQPAGVAAHGGTAEGRQAAPALAGDALDGSSPLDLGVQGRPVVVNFWASCAARPHRGPRSGAFSRARPRGKHAVGQLRRPVARRRRGVAAKSSWTWPNVFDPSGGIQHAGRRRRPATFLVGRRQAPRRGSLGGRPRASSTSWWRRSDAGGHRALVSASQPRWRRASSRSCRPACRRWCRRICRSRPAWRTATCSRTRGASPSRPGSSCSGVSTTMFSAYGAGVGWAARR